MDPKELSMPSLWEAAKSWILVGEQSTRCAGTSIAASSSHHFCALFFPRHLAEKPKAEKTVLTLLSGQVRIKTALSLDFRLRLSSLSWRFFFNTVFYLISLFFMGHFFVQLNRAWYFPKSILQVLHFRHHILSLVSKVRFMLPRSVCVRVNVRVYMKWKTHCSLN